MVMRPYDPFTTPRYEDIDIGFKLPEVAQKLTIPVMQRWVAATETLRRDHYDAKYAIEHDHIPGCVMSGSFSQAYMWQLLFNWVGPDGWVCRTAQRNAMSVNPGHIITFFGIVTDKYVKNGLGYLDLDIGLRIQDGTVAVPGKATVVLPLKKGRPVPYPFVP